MRLVANQYLHHIMLPPGKVAMDPSNTIHLQHSTSDPHKVICRKFYPRGVVIMMLYTVYMWTAQDYSWTLCLLCDDICTSLLPRAAHLITLHTSCTHIHCQTFFSENASQRKELAVLKKLCEGHFHHDNLCRVLDTSLERVPVVSWRGAFTTSLMEGEGWVC